MKRTQLAADERARPPLRQPCTGDRDTERACHYGDAVRAYHVTSSLNRASIADHGLDWERMGIACGIAGSPVPETEGVFLCRDEFEADWFVRINNTGGPVDVWMIEGIDRESLIDNGSGYAYVRHKIPAPNLTLLRSDLYHDEAH
jgi:hypothetical protein